MNTLYSTAQAYPVLQVAVQFNGGSQGDHPRGGFHNEVGGSWENHLVDDGAN